MAWPGLACLPGAGGADPGFGAGKRRGGAAAAARGGRAGGRARAGWRAREGWAGAGIQLPFRQPQVRPQGATSFTNQPASVSGPGSTGALSPPAEQPRSALPSPSRVPLRCRAQDEGFGSAVRALQMRLDTLPREDWDAVQVEAKTFCSGVPSSERLSLFKGTGFPCCLGDIALQRDVLRRHASPAAVLLRAAVCWPHAACVRCMCCTGASALQPDSLPQAHADLPQPLACILHIDALQPAVRRFVRLALPAG